MFKLLHSKTNQELYEKHLYNQSSHYENYKWCHLPQLIKVLHTSFMSEKWNIHYASLLTIFDLLHSDTNQDLVKKYPVIKVATIKNTEDFH